MIMEIRKYVLVFCFSEDSRDLVLIKKNRPEQLKDKLNALGGKIEPGESPIEAAVREVREESGLSFCHDQLKFVAHFEKVPNAEITIYAVWSDEIQHAKTMEDEQIFILDTKYLHTFNIMPNLNWLIPLCIHNQNPLEIKEVYATWEGIKGGFSGAAMHVSGVDDYVELPNKDVGIPVVADIKEIK